MNILRDAESRVYGDRARQYGHPSKHFACTVAMVNAYLTRRGLLRHGVGLLAEDWPMIMQLEKLSRQAGSLEHSGELHRDTLVDQAGWAGAAERLSEPDEHLKSLPQPKLEVAEGEYEAGWMGREEIRAQ